MPTRRALAAAAAAGVLLTACGDGETPDLQPIREDLDAQAEAQTAIRERISEVEEALALLGDDSDTSATLDELGGRLSAIDEAIAGLQETVSGLGETSAANGSRIEQVSGTLAQVESAVTELRNELAALSEDMEVLRRRIDDHERGHGSG